MNFTRSHSPKHSHSRVGSRALLGSRARLGLVVAMLGTTALVAGCGGSSNSSSIGVGNESNINSVPTVKGETTPTTATKPTTTKCPSGSPTPCAYAATTPTSGPLSKKPTVTVPSGPAPTTLVTKELIKGTGLEAKPGQSVTVNYVGVLYHGGKEFDASWKRSEPFTFALGKGQVIKGWDQGVAGMKVGGRRMLIIPAELGYGKTGSPPVIPPNASLVFVVDLLGV
jgi:peptidylprolyl isomerase